MTTTTKRPLPANVQAAIRERLRARMERERRQKELIGKEDLWHGQICDKLETLEIPAYVEKHLKPTEEFPEGQVQWLRNHPWLDNFGSCGTQEFSRRCNCCGKIETFKSSCSQKFCPRCAWKVTKKRQQIIECWARRVKNPQHLVLTQRNFETLTSRKISQHTKNLQKFRRKKVFANVRGGTCSVEITNEGRGWHLHSHWLLDAARLDPAAIAIAWGKLVGQEYAIVKVKPVKSTDYVSELAKYVCEGSAMAQWTPEQIWEFLLAIRRKRFFFAFGSILEEKAEVLEQIRFMQPERKPCECGSRDFGWAPPPSDFQPLEVKRPAPLKNAGVDYETTTPCLL